MMKQFVTNVLKALVCALVVVNMGLTMSVTTFAANSEEIPAEWLADKERLTSEYFEEAINAFRRSNNLNTLEFDSKGSMYKGAEIRAKECATKYSHTRPNGQPWYTVAADSIYGENLSKHDITKYQLDATMQGWIQSPKHLENLMDPEWKTASVAVYWEGDTAYVALEFGL